MNNITSIEQLAQYSQGQVVNLPDFAEGQPFVARLKRPSMLALAKSGKIPNSLLTKANSLFLGKGISEKDPSALKGIWDILDIVCDACFLEPTYKQIQESGIELTDEQYMFVFNYAQKGVKALESFRDKPRNNEPSVNVSEVQKNTV